MLDKKLRVETIFASDLVMDIDVFLISGILGLSFEKKCLKTVSVSYLKYEISCKSETGFNGWV